MSGKDEENWYENAHSFPSNNKGISIYNHIASVSVGRDSDGKKQKAPQMKIPWKIGGDNTEKAEKMRTNSLLNFHSRTGGNTEYYYMRLYMVGNT